jgi:putative SOS response-associated peptidase YedK
MCGRYYRTADKSALPHVFKAVATGAAASYAPAYNIPPHSIQLIARQDAGRIDPYPDIGT